MARSGRVGVVLLLAAAAVVGATAQEMCPTRAGFEGCRRRGCMSVQTTRRSSTVVCNSCAAGYALVNGGSRTAKCECAPGFAGKGNSGVCTKCPEGTDIALGGSITQSECLKCPAGTLLSRDGTECLCAAGHYRANARASDVGGEGFVPVACKLCTGRNQYIAGGMHASRSCSSCPSGQVANRMHTACVSPSSPEAALEAPLPGLSGLTLTDIQTAIQEARGRAEHATIARIEGVTEQLSGITPFGRNVFEEPLASAISGQSIANLPAALAKLPSLAELSKMTPEERAAAFDLEGLTSEVSAQLAKLDLAELRRMNVSSITDIKLDDLRKLNLTALATELVSNVNTTQVTSAVTRSIGGIAAMIPRLPDPAYIAGFKLDPEALEAAGLPNVRSVPELFATIMRGTLEDLDLSEWTA